MNMKEHHEKAVDFSLRAAQEKIQNNDISAALEILLEAVKTAPDNVEIINQAASCYYIMGDFERAEACWKRVVELDASNEEALSRLSHYKSPSFQFWLKRYREAVSHIENKKYADAKSLLRQLMEENDSFIGLYQLLGLCFLACHDKKNAQKFWEKGLELDKSNKPLLNYLNGFNSKNKFTTEEDQLNKYAAIKSFLKKNKTVWVAGCAICLVLLIQVHLLVNSSRENYKLMEDMQAKIKYLSEKIEEQSSAVSATASYDSTTILENTGQVVEGNSVAENQYDPGWEKHYYEQGYNAYLAGDLKAAAKNLKTVVDMQSHSYLNREALYYLARVYFLSSEYGEAEKYYLEYLAEFPDSNYYDDSLYYLGCVYHYTDQDSKAVEMFKKLQQLDPYSGYTVTPLFKEVMQD